MIRTVSGNMITSPPVDEVGVAERIARLGKRSIKKDTKRSWLRLAITMMDLTTLEGKDSEGKVVQLCRKAIRPAPDHPDIPSVAAICVYPPFVSLAKKTLGNSGVKVASVATAFPSGQAPLPAKLDEVRKCVIDGADEIDMVISRGAFLRGEYDRVFDEIAAVKDACGQSHLKVILETGELGSLDQVRVASDIALSAGADFIKTSTGKVQPAATLPVTLVMLEAIRDHYYRTGRLVGMKPAGGIRDSKTALHYLVTVAETLGDDWMTPDLFRFGASSLLNDVLMQLVKMDDGGWYQGADYFTAD
jgi:deoxyribose-phosphate aldolase